MTTTVLRDPATTAVLLTALLERAAHERVEVVKLTDEEVSLLDGPEANQIAPFPWLSTLDAGQQETAREVAARNLVVRGLAALSVTDEPDGDVAIGVEDDVYAALAARRASSAIVIAQRRAPADDRTRVVYVEGDQGAVEEEVSPGGLHTFSAASLELAIDGLCAFVDPRGVADEDGPEEELALESGEAALEALLPVDEAEWVSVVAAVVPGTAGPEEHRLAVVALPDSVRVCLPVPDRSTAVLRAVGGQSLRALLSDLVPAEARR